MSDQTPKRPKVRRAIMSDLTDGQSGMGYHSSDSNSPRNRSPLNQVKNQARKSYRKRPPKTSTQPKIPARFRPKLQIFNLKLTQTTKSQNKTQAIEDAKDDLMTFDSLLFENLD